MLHQTNPANTSPQNIVVAVTVIKMSLKCCFMAFSSQDTRRSAWLGELAFGFGACNPEKALGISALESSDASKRFASGISGGEGGRCLGK